jgi:hypothetical protein
LRKKPDPIMVQVSSGLLNFVTSIIYLHNNAALPLKYSFLPSSCHTPVFAPLTASMAGCPASNGGTLFRAPVDMVLICYLPSKMALPKSSWSLLDVTNESPSLLNTCTAFCYVSISPMRKMLQYMPLHSSLSMVSAGQLTLAITT